MRAIRMKTDLYHFSKTQRALKTDNQAHKYTEFTTSLVMTSNCTNQTLYFVLLFDLK